MPTEISLDVDLPAARLKLFILFENEPRYRFTPYIREYVNVPTLRTRRSVSKTVRRLVRVTAAPPFKKPILFGVCYLAISRMLQYELMR